MDDALNKQVTSERAGRAAAGVNLTAWSVIFMRVLVAGCTLAVGVWASCPWPGTAGLALLGVVAVAAELAPHALSGRVWKGTLGLLCALSLLVPASFLFVADRHFTLNYYARYYQAVLAWMVGVSVLPAGIHVANSVALKPAGMICALIASTLWLAGAWDHNLRGVLYLGLVVLAALLVLGKRWFRLTGTVILVVNTLILLILGLGIVDLFIPAPARPEPHLAAARKYYSYDEAKKDPLAFSRWWNYFVEQWLLMSKDIMVPDRGRRPSFHLRPGSRSQLFDCAILINRLGFRGREISPAKGAAYRIVALGESTTFGCTLGPKDSPWPELLERMIRERLAPRRPVQIINAGVPGYTLEANLHRLSQDILPLRPDMIISYHGYNGFPLLDKALPAVSGETPPFYRSRPLRLLANCEYRVKMSLYRRRHALPTRPTTLAAPDLMETDCARVYRALVQVAETNNIRLVLATFSMAVNGQSDPDVVDFYRAGFPFVRRQIEANLLQTKLLQQLVRQRPELCLVDTQPGLDGEHELFVDLVHMSQEGRRRLAETLFASIRSILEQVLLRPDSLPAGG